MASLLIMLCSLFSSFTTEANPLIQPTFLIKWCCIYSSKRRHRKKIKHWYQTVPSSHSAKFLSSSVPLAHSVTVTKHIAEIPTLCDLPAWKFKVLWTKHQTCKEHLVSRAAQFAAIALKGGLCLRTISLACQYNGPCDQRPSLLRSLGGLSCGCGLISDWKM